jgi:tetratricopeptide (TPR) repeat protein
MKHLIGLTFASAIVLNVNAQSAVDGFKLIYYKKYESAISAMQPLADKNPEAALALGVAYLELDKFNEAKNAFAKISDKDWMSKIGQAYVYAYEGNKTQVETLLNSVVDGAKKKDWQKYKLAADVVAYTDKGNIESAVAWYEKAIDINADPLTYLNQGYLYMNRLNRGGAAFNSFNSAAKSTDKAIQSLAYNYLGSLGLRSRDAELAITNFDKSKAADPTNPMPFLQLAKQYDKTTNKASLALENVEQFYQNSDKRYIDKIDYVNILIGGKEYTKAEKILEELLKTNADKATLYRAMAYSQYENKKYDEALKSINTYFNKTTDKTTLTVDDYSYAGKIYVAMAKNDEANEASLLNNAHDFFAKAIAADTATKKRETYLEIGKIFQGINNFEGAAKYYNMIIAENPGVATTSTFDYYNAGVATYYAKKPQEALEIFTKMATLHPDEPVAVYWQARSAMATDVKAETGAAEQYYVQWLAIEKEGYTPQVKDKITGYEYLIQYYVNKKDYKAAAAAADSLLLLDADHQYAQSIKKFVTSGK